MKRMKRILSLLLALAMVLSLFPGFALSAAAETAPAAEPEQDPGPFKFTVDPKPGSIAPDGTYKFTWGTNFSPKKIEITGQGFLDLTPRYLATLSGPATSYAMFYNTAAVCGSYANCQVRAYYGSGEYDYVSSAVFRISLTSRQFTIQPQPGSISSCDGSHFLYWNVNFIPRKIQILAKKSLDFQMKLVKELHGFTTCWFLDYQTALLNGGVSGSYVVRAYYGDGESDFISSETFNVFLTRPAFTECPSGLTIDPDNVARMDWATNFHPVKIEIQGKNSLDYMYGFETVATLAGNTSCYYLFYDKALRFENSSTFRIKAYYGPGADDWVASDSLPVYLNPTAFSPQPSFSGPDANGNLMISWNTNFSPSSIEIQAKNWNDFITSFRTIKTLPGNRVDYTLPYNDAIAIGLSGSYRIFAYYANGSKRLVSNTFSLHLPKPAFVSCPSAERIEPGDSCTLRWELNYPPKKLIVRARSFTTFIPNYTTIATYYDPPKTGSYILDYSEAEQFGTNGRYQIVACYGDDDYFAATDEFTVYLTPRSFTQSPVGGRLVVGGALTLNWDTNFPASGYAICGRGFLDGFTSCTYVTSIFGDVRTYHLTYQDAAQFGDLSWIWVRAFHEGGYTDSQATLVSAFTTLFTEQPPASVTIPEGGSVEISWASSVAVSSLKLMLIPEGSSEELEFDTLDPDATAAEIGFSDLEQALRSNGFQLDTGKLFLRAVCPQGSFDSQQILFELDYDDEGSIGNLAWDFDRISGLLKITGSGAMPELAKFPWEKYTAQIKTLEIGNGVTVVSANAFRGGAAMRTVKLPGTLREIHQNAFQGCSYVTGVFFDGSTVAWNAVTMSIGNTNLTAVTVRTSCYDQGSCGTGLSWTLSNDDVLTITGSGAIPDYDDADNKAPWAAYRSRIVKLVLTNNVTGIGSYAFSGCTALQTVDASSARIGTVGESAFCGCAQLRSASGFYDYLTSLGANAFQGCSSLKYISLSNYLSSIPSYAFCGCSALTTAVIPFNAVSIGDHAYYGCTSLKSVRFSQGGRTTQIGSYAFCGCTTLSGVALPDQITAIYSCAFENCTALKTLHLPASLRTLGSYAFYNCKALETKLTLPEGLTAISANSFRHCNQLTEIHLNDGLTSIGDYAFDDSGLGGFLTLPAGVTTIGVGALRGTKLFSLTLPASLTEIKDNAFSGCSKLGVVWYQGLQSQWQQIIIGSGNAPLTGAALHCQGSSGLIGGIKWNVWGDGVLTVCNPANGSIPDMSAGGQPWAAYASDIKTVEVLNNTGGIGANAFRDLPNLQTVYLAESVKTIGQNAFANCPSLSYASTDNSEYYWDTYVTVASGNAALTDVLRFSDAWDYLGDGTDLGWWIEGDTLIIDSAATGGDEFAIPDFGNGEMTPWYDYAGAIKRVRFGGCVTRIGSGTLRGMSRVTEVEIPLACFEIGEAAFDCPKLQTVYYGGMSGDWSWMTIGENNDELSAAAIVYGCVSDLISGADLRWRLDASGTLSVSLRQGHEERYAIPDYPDKNTRPWAANQGQIQKLVLEEGVTGIGGNAFAELTNLREVVLPETLTVIGDEAFYRSGLQSLVIPDGVTELGVAAFQYCAQLQSVTLPAGITEIPIGCFSDCGALTGVSVPEGVTILRTSGFRNCTHLQWVRLPASLTTVVSSAFSNCSSLQDAYYGCCWFAFSALQSGISTSGNASLLTAARHFEPFGGELESGLLWELKENGCLEIAGDGPMPEFAAPDDQPWASVRGHITSVSVGDGVTTVGRNAFRLCKQAASVTLGDSVTKLGNLAFYDCDGLTSVTVPEGVKTISGNCFGSCPNLVSATLPSTLTLLDGASFADCGKLAAINLPAGLTTIGTNSFLNCAALTSVEIPENVTDIWNTAFKGCTSLASVRIEENVTNIRKGTFEGCTALANVYYGGLEERWQSTVNIADDNDCLTGAAIHFLGVADNENNFPDEGFRELLFGGGAKSGNDYDLNGDGYLSEDELAAVREISCEGMELSSLVGIGLFPNLELLECSENLLTELDLSGLTNLISLSCYGNRLTSLDLTGMENLEQLDCDLNFLTSLDLTDCGNLWYLSCGDNALTELDLTPVPLLEVLYAAGNRIGELDVSEMTELRRMDCSMNGMTALVLNDRLDDLWCDGNALAELDLTPNARLIKTVKEGETNEGNNRLLYERTGSVLNVDAGVRLLGLPPVVEVHFVYKPNDGIDNHPVYAYAFGDNGVENAPWPGLLLDDDVIDVICDAGTNDSVTCSAYHLSLDSYLYHHVVFTDGSDQTADLVLTADAIESGGTFYKVWYADDFDEVHPGTDLWPLSSAASVDPTCTEDGSDTYFGLITLAPVTEIQPAGGHIFRKGEDHAPSCTEQGWTDYVCLACESVEPRDFTDALGHDFGDWIETSAPSCEDPGEQERVCSVCNASEFSVLEALGHQWEPPVYSFSETDAGMRCTASADCAICSDTRSETVPGAYAVISEPSDEQTGLGTYVFEFEDALFVSQIRNVELLMEDAEYVTVYVVDRSDALRLGYSIWGDAGQFDYPPIMPMGIDKDGCYYYRCKVNVTAYGDGFRFNDGGDAQCPEGDGLDLVADAAGNAWVVYALDAAYTSQTIDDVWAEPSTVLTAPTCLDDGEATYTGVATGQLRSFPLPALGHDYADGVCTRCGAIDPDSYPNPFADVPQNAYYYEAVLWALENGITAGTSDVTFSPNQECTRGQIVTFLWRAAGSPVPTLETLPFTDVPQTAYYSDAVRWAVEHGITGGVSESLFCPDRTCTRAEAVTFLWRASGSQTPILTDMPFSDVPVDGWYTTPVLWAVENNITAGTSDTTFSPAQICTRCQIVTFLWHAHGDGE